MPSWGKGQVSATPRVTCSSRASTVPAGGSPGRGPVPKRWAAMVPKDGVMKPYLSLQAVRGLRLFYPRPHPLNTKAAPAAIRAKPIRWFQVRLSLRKNTEKPAKMTSVITSWIVFSCAAE